MMTIDLDTDQERRLRQLAESLGQDPSVLAGHIVEAYLELHAGMDDSARRWAEASVALAPEIFEKEPRDREMTGGPG